MQVTPIIDVSVAGIRSDEKSGTRIAVFQDRKKTLLSPAAEFAQYADVVAEIMQEGMKQFLAPYVGPALVIEVTGTELSAQTFIPIFDRLTKLTPQAFPSRILLKSGWKAPAPMPVLTLDGVLYLYGLGMELIGVDWPVLQDEADVTFLMRDNNVVWLVNLDLSDAVAERIFLLYAMPIRTDQDGETACRALLIPLRNKP
jgi:hypothetical protein